MRTRLSTEMISILDDLISWRQAGISETLFVWLPCVRQVLGHIEEQQLLHRYRDFLCQKQLYTAFPSQWSSAS